MYAGLMKKISNGVLAKTGQAPAAPGVQHRPQVDAVGETFPSKQTGKAGFAKPAFFVPITLPA